MDLTIEQQAYNFKTMRHIERVRNLINKFCQNMQHRGELHDQCKLDTPEVEAFCAAKPLNQLTYNSPEYIENTRQLDTALQHHYARSRHHPQHFKHGINDMTLEDLVEMFIDWQASSERQDNGNILKSIEDNGVKFEMSPQLVRIFENTAKAL